MKKVTIDGHTYKSIREAAEVLGVSAPTIKRYAKYGTKDIPKKKKKGMSDEHKAQIVKTQSKPVEIDGVMYKSREEAAKGLGVSVNTIYNWIKRDKNLTKDENPDNVADTDSMANVVFVYSHLK